MARVVSAGWVSGSVTPARLRLYHLLFIVFATVAATAVAAPSVLSQPTLYTASAMVRFDPVSLPGLVEGDQATPTLDDAQKQLGEVLKDRYEGLGSRTRGLQYNVVGPDQIEVVGFTPFVSQSVTLTNEAADGLARRLYAVEGTPILRDILGKQLQASLEGHPARTQEDLYLRKIIETDALYGGITPTQGERSIETLSTEERFAVTRAIEIQYDLTNLDERKAERTLAQGGDDATLDAARADRKRASDRKIALRVMLGYLYDTYRTEYDLAAQAGPVFVATRAASAAPIPTYTLGKLLLAALVGFLGGLFTVLLDRAVGIVAKLAELWAYRDLMRNMVMRDLRARYKNSLLGYFWSLINPLLTMLIFWLVFSVLLRNNIPMFPVFLIVALLPWNFAITSVSSGMRSILDNSHLVSKVYFPREILPITVVLANLVNYVLALPVMFLVMAAVQTVQLGHLNFSWTFAFLPVLIVIQIIFLIGMTLLLSTIAVFFRDTIHIIDILLQLWMFLTPVFYTLETVTQGNTLAATAVRWLNPMASLIDFYRDILYGQATGPTPGIPALDGVFRTLVTALVILAVGAYVFHRYSGRFGEEL
jgi:lipopolysaccharide transport system permease protein